MTEILQNYELIAANLSPAASVGLGLTAVLAGLIIWLGGLGFRKLLPAIAGAIGGGTVVFFITGKYTFTALSAAATCLAAVIYERAFSIILSTALAIVLGFGLLAGPYIEQASSLKELCQQMPVRSWIIIAGLAIFFTTSGLYFRHLTPALCCSVLGTLLIFAGMILLLLNKGTTPASSIIQKPLFYAAVFAVMTSFGITVQILFCLNAAGKSTGKNQTDKDKQGAGKRPLDWRVK